MPSPTVEAKQDQVAALREEEQALDLEIERLTKKVLALQDSAEARRQEVQTSFRKKYEPKFEDVDVVKALSGYPSPHACRIFSGVYKIQPPTQELVVAAQAFVANPVDPADEKKKLARVSSHEEMLLSWLVSVGGGDGDEAQDLSKMPLGNKLLLLRRLPEVVLTKLAEECATLQAYLNVVLEHELGN